MSKLTSLTQQVLNHSGSDKHIAIINIHYGNKIADSLNPAQHYQLFDMLTPFTHPSPGSPAGRSTQEMHGFATQELPHGGTDHGSTVSRPALQDWRRLLAACITNVPLLPKRKKYPTYIPWIRCFPGAFKLQLPRFTVAVVHFVRKNKFKALKLLL